jgi:hypothetical protein
VSVHTTAPAWFKLAALQDAVTPLGNPDTTLMLDPAAPVATIRPPTGAAVTVTVVVDKDFMEADVGEAPSVAPGACSTCRVNFCVEVRPSPLAVTDKVDDPGAAAPEAVSVSVDPFELVPDAPVIGFADHAAVTPAGNPVSDRVMLPVYAPAVAAVKLMLPGVPCSVVIEVDADVSVSAGAAFTVSAYATL